MNFYSTFLGIKGLLNLGAGVVAAVTGRYDMVGFWVLIGLADLWMAAFAWRSL